MGEELVRTGRRLPHWRLENAVYFVTWRLHPSQAVLITEERMETSIAIKFFKDQRYRLLDYVVMDDHVHAIVQPWAEHTLSRILHSWKSFTAHRFIKKRGTEPPFWQDESLDRIVRDQEELDEKLTYVLNNPLKRWPEEAAYSWVEWFPWESDC